MIAYEVWIIARANLIKFIMNCSILMGQIDKWAIILIEFDIIYIPHKEIKGNFLIAHLVSDDSLLIMDLPD